ncbi:dTDP-4-dehydrorhamnose 3,5-epimerase [Modestobacter sp. I12A-02662]|uniref:dTDP-4-dehydrorhamnose 3,5-epimerase n=1 Tax=Modestobacter sp. I12A-02662 TaxID=1730496 RepID=UPI0034DE84F7
MKYTPLGVDGVHLVEMEPFSDERGFFARSFDTAEFEQHGMRPEVAQCNVSFNHRAGTLRGLHLSLPGHPEAKFIRCTRGAIVDVAVDVRPDSPTYLQHVAVELTAENRTALYLPPHLAHAYQTLTDDTEVLYMVSVPYAPGAEMGFRYDDPAFGVEWPLPVSVISDKDAAWAPFDADANTERFATGVRA